jgi:ABC-type sugar transport system ATPase subunit
MDEVFTTCDQVTVLRDGKVMATLPLNAIQPDEVIRLMIGREICLKKSTTRKPTDDQTRLRVKGLYGRFLKNIHFVGRRGEILGLGGLMGSGRTTLLQTLFGCRPMSQGWIEVDGQRLSPHSARQSMNAGLAYIPEDRKADGLALQLTIAENFALPILDRLQRCGWLKRGERTRTAESLARQLGLRYRRVSDRVERLSGGNQQKIVLGKWLARAPRVLLLDEPTRGIDVGAKADIHRLIQELADAGICAILASSDMPELLSLCDRILVMREGEITGELAGEQRTEEAILRMAAPPSEGHPL